MLRLLPVFVFAASFFAATASALTPADLKRILDADELEFTLETTHGTLSEETNVVAMGGSSLAVRPTLEPDENRHTVNFKLTIPQAGPGRFTCRVRAHRANPALFNLNYYGATGLPDPALEDTWYKVSFPVYPHQQEVVFAMWPYLESGDAVFYFDDFSFQPGVVFTTEHLPAAGSITLSPDKDLYAVGESVTVSLNSTDPSITPSILQIDTFQGLVSDRPATFQIVAERDLAFIASYQQDLDFGAFKGRATLADSIIDLDDPDGFSFSRLTLTDLPGGSLLAFELAPAARSTVTIADGSPITRADVTQPASLGTPLVYLDQALDFEYPVDELVIETGSTWWAPRPAAVRNLQLLTSAEVVPEISGKGSVAASYQPGPRPGTTLASLTAVPEDGWSFLRWEGLASSDSPSLELLIDRPQAITAQFAQVFHLGPSVWAFPHQGELDISRTADGEGFRIQAESIPTFVGYETTVYRQGPLSARVFVYEADGETLSYTENAFSHHQTILKTPQTVSGFFSLWNKTIAEIRDVVVSGGVGYDDTTLVIDASPDSVAVSPKQASYTHGQELKLSIAEPYRDRFLAWTGDIHSNSPDLSLVLEKPTRVTALFQQSWTSDSGRQIANTGSHLLPAPSSLADLSFPATEFATGTWSELVIEKAADVVVGLSFNPSFGYVEPRAFVGGRELHGGEKLLKDGVWYLQSLEPSDEPIRLRFENNAYGTKQIAISRIAFYSDANSWTPKDAPGLGGGSVSIVPPKRYHEIGSQVSLQATPDHAFAFVGWGDTSPTPDVGGSFVVPQDGLARLLPEFAPATPIPGLAFLSKASTGWSFQFADKLRLAANDLLEDDETLTLAFQTTGPGVLAFQPSYVSFHEDPLEVEILVDGIQVPVGNYNVTTHAYDWEALLPGGDHRVEIKASLSEQARQAGALVSNLNLSDFQFLRGYAVSYSSDYPHLPKVAGQKWPSVYPAGSSVTISPDFIGGETFGSWTGDLAEHSSASVTLTLDRHIIANPKPSTSAKAGILSASVSDNASFTASSPFANSLDYFLNSSSGPTRILFEIPAMTQLDLEIQGASGPVKALANGVLAFQGDPGDVSIAFPVKESSQQIELLIELDPEHAQPTRVIATAYQRFTLTGDFGASQEHVIADPQKDDYAPGEKVTVKLGNGAPGGHGFYDVVAAYPSLALFDWLEVEGQRSFEIEMSSHVVLLGQVGVSPTRSLGQISPGRGLAMSNSPTRSPDNRPIQTGQLNGDSAAPFFRIATDGAKHIEFWIQAPPLMDVVFSEVEVDGLPFAIEGNGLWQKASLAVPSGQKYLSAFILSYSSAAETFGISSVKAMSGYGIQYLITGNADIVASPANGVASAASQIDLTLVPADGFHLASWNDTAGTPLERSLKPNGQPFLLPVLEEDPVYRTLGEIDFLLHNVELLPDATGVRLATDGASLSASVTGPGRITYQADHSGVGSLEVRIDGAPYDPYEFFRQPYLPSQPTLPIPSGEHLVEFVFLKSRPTSEGSLSLSEFRFEPGVYLQPEPYPANGSLTVAPSQTFVPLGSPVTISAQPHFEYKFHSWTGDLADATLRSPYSFTPDDHSRFGVAFRRDSSYEAKGIRWNVVSESSTPNLSDLTANLQGPAYLRISYHLAEDPNFAAYLNERVVRPVAHDYRYYLPIPHGNHQLRLQANSSASFYQSAVDYVPGYLFLLTGNSDALHVSPKQESYLGGARLSIALDPQALGPASLRYRIGDQVLAQQQAIDFVVNRHVILPVHRMEPFFGTDFQTDGNLDKLQASEGPDGLRFTVAGPVFEPLSLYREVVGPAKLSFQLDQLRDWEVRLFVDDKLALAFSESSRPDLKIPGGSHSLRWEFQSFSNIPTDPMATLSNIRISTTQLSPFEQWMAHAIPASRFVAGINVGPDQDLDGDGYSNSAEQTRSSSPHRFDFWDQIIRSKVDQLQLVFELSSHIHRDSISVLAFDPQHPTPAWTRYPLATLTHEFRPTETSARSELSIPISGPLVNATLFCLEVSNSASNPAEE